MATLSTLVGAAHLQQEVRKSRFLAHAAPVDDVAGALAFIARLRASDASHNCWAYRIGAQYRFNDDGEPGGTAGKPILQAIDGQALDRVAVVVARWFGGIKLGAGGLVRAYGGCAAECLRTAAKRELVARATVRIACDFATAATLHSRLSEFDAIKRGEQFTVDRVELTLDVPTLRIAALGDFLRDLTRGRGSLQIVPSLASEETGAGH